MGLLDWLRPAPKCPVEPEMRAWIDSRWKWLEEQFGVAFLRGRDVILPSPDYFPEPYEGSEDDIRRMIERVCEYMSIDPETIEISFYDDSDPIADHPMFAGAMRPGTAGLYHADGGKYRIWLEVGGLEDPLGLVATMAHELSHVHLLGHGRIPDETEDHEPLTDLLTVFMGLGVFTANSVIREKHWNEGQYSGWQMSRKGYLGMREFGYAFACFARSRGEESPNWARELRPDVRAAFHDASRVLAAEQATRRE
jgi:hypothetical protein